MGVSKNRDTSKIDGETNGKPYFLMDDLGGKTHHFRKHPYVPLYRGSSLHFAGVSLQVCGHKISMHRSDLAMRTMTDFLEVEGFGCREVLEVGLGFFVSSCCGGGGGG